MPQEECPYTINISNSERHTLRHLIRKILSHMVLYEEEEGYYLDRSKMDTFEIYLHPDQVPALEKFVKKLSGV